MIRNLNSFVCLRVVLALLLFITAIVYAQSEDSVVKLSQDLIVTKIDEDIFVVTHSFPWPSNSLLVRVSSTDVVFVDTPYSNLATQLVVEWTRNRFGDVNFFEINTGFHVDNLGGNGYLLAQNVPAYGSDLTAMLLEDKGEETRKQILEWLGSPEQQRFYEVHKDLEYYPPDHMFSLTDGLELSIGDEDVEVFFPGASHTPDNVVVYFPNRQILFGGCMIKSLESKNLGFTGDADLDEWPESAKRILVQYKDSKIVIPGHGKWGDLSLVDHTIELLEQE
jgi:glyoxylase-like metal-dependent hydrolase (beta-lactamase superfamily II)